MLEGEQGDFSVEHRPFSTVGYLRTVINELVGGSFTDVDLYLGGQIVEGNFPLEGCGNWFSYVCRERVVYVDADTLVLRPLDGLFGLFLGNAIGT